MKVNKTYRSLLDKSISSMLSAIEIYNKPDFQYREESFAILAVNAWELILKAYWFRINKYNMNSIYEREPAKNKNGSSSKSKKQFCLNRCGNPKSISIYTAINNLDLSNNLKANLEALIELRDNSIHFINMDSISRQIQELGFACIKNYIFFIKKWSIDIDLSRYNFYLMPLAYIDEKKVVNSAVTTEIDNYIQLISSKLYKKDESDSDYDIAISIDIKFNKGNSFDAVEFKYDPQGIPIHITEEDLRKKFPITYNKLILDCRKRYSDFKQNKDFNKTMKQIKSDSKLYNPRKLDPDNPKSQSKPYYSTNIWKELDKQYTKN